MILNAENVKCIHFVYIIVYIIYTAMYTLCTFSCIHFVCITSVRCFQEASTSKLVLKPGQNAQFYMPDNEEHSLHQATIVSRAGK